MSQPNPARIFLVDSDQATYEQVTSALTREGYEVTQVKTGEEAFARSARLLPDVAIVEAVLPGMDGYTLTRNWRQNESTRSLPILMLTSQGEVADKLAGFEAGVDDYLTKPFLPQELTFRVKGLLARSRMAATAGPPAKKKGRIVAIFGTKGGVGKTTLAVNLSVALKRRTQKRVALVDADFFFGDVPLHLTLAPTTTVMDLIERIDQLEPELVEKVLITHSSGVRVLLGPTQPEHAEKITSEHIERLLDTLSQMYDFVVVDCHPNYDDRNLQILEQADQILFVVRPELGPLRNMGVFLNLVFKLGLRPEKIHIVLNRAGSKSGIEVEQIERSFKSRVEFRMISGGRAVVTSVNRGTPIILQNPRHRLSKQIVTIADYLARQSLNGHVDSAQVQAKVKH
jgi:pilus assembly protein CpaE